MLTIHILLSLLFIYSAYARKAICTSEECKRNRACKERDGYDFYSEGCLSFPVEKWRKGTGHATPMFCYRCCKFSSPQGHGKCDYTEWSGTTIIKTEDRYGSKPWTTTEARSSFAWPMQFPPDKRRGGGGIEEIISVTDLEKDCKKALYKIGYFIQLPSEHFEIIFQALSKKKKCQEDYVFHSELVSDEEGTPVELKLVPAYTQDTDFPIFQFDAIVSGEEIAAAFASLPEPYPYDVFEHNCVESIIHILDTLNIPIIQDAIDFAKYKLLTSSRLVDYLHKKSSLLLGFDTTSDYLLVEKLITRTLQASENEQTQELGEKLNQEIDAQIQEDDDDGATFNNRVAIAGLVLGCISLFVILVIAVVLMMRSRKSVETF